MSEFELLRNVAIGQYLPRESVLHRLDPRVKLLGTILLMAALMGQRRPAMLLVGLLLVGGLFLLARAPLGHALRGLRPLLPLFFIVLVLQLFFYPHRQAVAAGSPALWQWGRFVLSGEGMIALAAMLLRMAALALVLTLLTSIADVTGLVHGVEGLLRPFQRLRLPAHEVSMVLVVALRFVPLLTREMERLMKAQAARGADFGRGRGGVIKRVRRTFPLLIPLFITTLRRAEELAVAMEARGYVGGKGRTHLVRLRFRPADLLALGVAAGASVGLFLVNLGPAERAVIDWLRHLLSGP